MHLSPQLSQSSLRSENVICISNGALAIIVIIITLNWEFSGDADVKRKEGEGRIYLQFKKVGFPIAFPLDYRNFRNFQEAYKFSSFQNREGRVQLGGWSHRFLKNALF